MTPAELIVSAAISLTDVLAPTAKAFEKENPGVTVRLNLAASGTLLQQIRQGAPADVFVCASPQEMDTLARERRIEARSRRVVAGNRLALIAPQGGALRRWEDLATPAVARVALSNPDFVPSGRYARETLTRRGLWAAVGPKAVFGENVRQTLAYVASGDADAGLVFVTDARAERRVRIVARAVPGRDHAPIRYPAAVLNGRPNAALARRFVAFLAGRTAHSLFLRFGFARP